MTDIRFITREEVHDFRIAISFGFGGDVAEEEGADERFEEVFPLETTIGAFDQGRIVATFGSFDFDLTVPGGSAVPMAGTTIVTVHPTHRRKGILSTMMRMHLEQAIDRGQPLAGLWASEAMIYGRFGYGNATNAHDLTVPMDKVKLPKGPDDIAVRFVDADEAAGILPGIYEQVRLATPGMLSRSEAWWRVRRLRDPEHWREGASSRRIVVASRGADPVGYVTYRQKEKWEGWIPEGAVEVIEVVAVDEDARRSLWSYLAGIDLFPNVHWELAPPENPLYVEVDNPRRLTTKHLDTLWIRILDIPAALTARRYESDGAITLGITDDFLGRGGTFTLTIDGGAATCVASDAEPDVTLSVADLGALYLGRPGALTRWRAGRISGEQASVEALDRLMRTARLPYCPEVF